MRRHSQRTGLTTLSEINITPLLDLAFVLLIIFIITTPLLENSVSLALPSSSATRSPVDPARMQMITIDRLETVTLNRESVDLEALRQRLTELHAANPEMAVIIRADEALPVQKLVSLIDVVQKAQITKIGIATKPESP